MENAQLEVSEKLFLMAKKQYYEHKNISREEYLETLELILKRLNKEEIKFQQLETFNSILLEKNFSINLKDTINYVLSNN